MQKTTYFDKIDIREIRQEFKLGGEFIDTYTKISRDELFSLQNKKFVRLMQRGWEIPFYQRLWGEKGIEPGDIRSLEDIEKLPVYDKSDLMKSINDYPPFGDFSGIELGNSTVVFHTTSGTTGRPQALLFGPRGREITNLLVGRMYNWQGLEDNDIVQSVYGHGMINGGHYIRESVIHFTNSLFLSAGTGIETRSSSQVNLMADFGVTVLVGFVDYIRKLASVARDEGLFDRLKVRMICGHLGTEDRAATEAAFNGAKAYDWYGVGDTGSIAGEGPDRDGLYVWEDAQYLEILDTQTQEKVIPGEIGDMVVTCLFKDDIAPCIRFNTHDISRELLTPSSTNMKFKRIAGFLGRSDNMVKLRGINVFPHAIGALIENRPDLTGEYICILKREHPSDRDNLLVKIESHGQSKAEELAIILRQGLGVEVDIEMVGAGQTASLTQIDIRQKPLRLLDERGL